VRRVPTDAQIDVGIVDSGGTHANEYFVGLRMRHRHIAPIFEPVEVTVPRE
jgi:hypothetical protein